MKKIILSLSCTLMFIAANSQWAGSSTTIGNVYRDGNVGIGISNSSFKLAVIGTTFVEDGIIVHAEPTNKIAGWFRGEPNGGSANIVLQASEGAGNAFWLSATNNLLKIGGTGGSEPVLGAINIIGGQVGIGTTQFGSMKLAVEGVIGARGIKVTTGNFPDYVFDSSYNRMDLNRLETYINQHKHLPGIPSAAEVEKDGGIELGEMTCKLLEKIEELTLYTIELNRQNEQMKQELKRLKKILNKN